MIIKKALISLVLLFPIILFLPSIVRAQTCSPAGIPSNLCGTDGGCPQGERCVRAVNQNRCIPDSSCPGYVPPEPTTRCGDTETVGKCGSAGGCDAGQLCYHCDSGQGCPADRCGFVNGECGYDEDEGLYSCGDPLSWNKNGRDGGCSSDSLWCKYTAGQGAGWSCRPGDPDENSIDRGEQAFNNLPTSYKVGQGCEQQQGYVNSAIGCIPYVDINATAQFLVRWALGVGGGIALFLISISAIKIMTVRGDQKRLQDARDTLSAAVAGIVLIVLSIFVIRFLTETLLNLF